MIKHVGFSLLDKFSKSFYPSKMRGHPMAGLLCNSGTSQQTQSPQIGEFSEDLPKSGGEGLGLWLRLGGWVGGRKTKETKKLFKQIEQKFFMGIPLPTSA